MANTHLTGSAGAGITPATQTEVETFTGSGALTSSNIQYAIGAVTSWIQLNYVYDVTGPSSYKCRIISSTGMNTADWDIHDPTTDTAAWIANGRCQKYVGNLAKNYLLMHSDMQVTTHSNLNPILFLPFTLSVWYLKDPQFNPVLVPDVLSATVYLVAIRKSV